MGEYREEKDYLGTVRIPAHRYYGAHTQRGRDNYPDTGLRLQRSFIKTLALVKKCAAQTNRELGLLDSSLCDAVTGAAVEVMDGKHDDEFVVDLFQTGSGTSTNMNMNEVLACRANEIITGRRAGKSPVHPNDHVNLGQSSNDVIPTCIHVSAARKINDELIPALKHLRDILEEKASRFAGTNKTGRTHLQDALPVSVGDEFSGFARQTALGVDRLEACLPRLYELALGGTAVGTGANTHPDFAAKVIKKLGEATGLPFVEAANHFEAQAAQDASVEASSTLKTIAAGLVKIANDLRWSACGPRCGLGEINLPELQPGSSIMPGKVNPVIPEVVVQIAYQIMGNDLSITFGGQSGNFELNTTLPLIAYNLIQSIDLLAAACDVLADKCVKGISVNEAVCQGHVEKSLSLVTLFVPHLGYDKAAALARKAHKTGKTIREIALEENLLPEKVIDEVLKGGKS